MNDRQRVMLDVWTHQHHTLAGLTPAELVAKLQQLASEGGTLQSRTQAPEFVGSLILWLIHQNITDQQLFERLETLADTVSDEYRSWSPEYTFPLTNQQVRWLCEFDSWTEVLMAVGTDSDNELAVLEGISSHHPGPVLVWVWDLPDPTEYLHQAEWLALKTRQ